MMPNAARVTFTKKKKTVACPVPLAPLADTHAHLLSFWGKEVPETLVRAKAAGVDLLVTMFDPIADKRSVTDYSDWLVREILPMQDIPQIKYLAGVHPYGAPDYTDDVHAQVVAALDDPLCAGIGE
ncbi:MAG: TatD family hydrolase, partial [Collinsella sp.]|nr:TatD family hydrolase [Collinsella sp.]